MRFSLMPLALRYKTYLESFAAIAEFFIKMNFDGVEVITIVATGRKRC